MGSAGPAGGPGGGGTITRISGSSLTLRTMNGTQIVDTSSSTKFRKELRTITFSDLRVGEVVRAMAVPASSGSGTTGKPASTSTRPPLPGTGTVDASRVTVIEPSFAGRVISVGSASITLVGPEGQLLGVSTTASTRYYKGTTKTSAAAVSDGEHVWASGPQDSLTHLNADVVVLAPVP